MIQTVFFSFLAIAVLRMKYLWTPYICVLASLVLCDNVSYTWILDKFHITSQVLVIHAINLYCCLCIFMGTCDQVLDIDGIFLHNLYHLNTKGLLSEYPTFKILHKGLVLRLLHNLDQCIVQVPDPGMLEGEYVRWMSIVSD